MTASRLVLASASPRRSQLLRQIGVEFVVSAQDINETPHELEAPRDYVQRMADEKAVAALGAPDRRDSDIVIASDTSVVSGTTILGKPASEAEAIEMLLSLSGREHEVMTAVTVINSERKEQQLSVSRVHFRQIEETEARDYWQSGEPKGKAGAYAIQGLGAIFVRWIEGSYSGVMGLPLFETAQLLAAFNVPVARPTSGEAT